MQKIEIVTPDASWPMQYEKEKKILQQIFSTFPIKFHHIGSTSIPGCSAKPIIDILGVTSDVLEIDGFNALLADYGFIALGEYGMKRRRFFRKRIPFAVHVHIFEDSDPEVARHLRFRDYLIAHSEEIQRYAVLKHKLAEKNPTDITAYILGKGDFIKNIDCRAAWEDTGKYWQRSTTAKKTVWSHKEVVDAMEANMHLHMTYFSKYVLVMNLQFEPDVTVVISTIPDDTFNYVIGATFDETHAAERVQHVAQLFISQKKPFSWWVFEKDRPVFLVSLLEKQGLLLKEENIGMSLFVKKEIFTRKIPELVIQRALSQVALKDFAEVMVNIGGYPYIYKQFFETIPPVLYGEGAPFEVYVGYIEGKPVVTGILVLHANVGGVYYIMTHLEYRKRGYGTEMILALLIRIKERGYHVATLQASAEGKKLYQKLGFEPIGKFIEYASLL